MNIKTINPFIIVIFLLLSLCLYGSCNDTNADEDNEDASPPANIFDPIQARLTTTSAPDLSFDNPTSTTLMQETSHPKRAGGKRHRTRPGYYPYAAISNESKSQSYCIPRPTKLQFCSSILDYGNTMRLPNMVNHKNETELSQTYYMLENLSKVQCEAISHLKLVICSLLTPTCLDTVVSPCRQSCLLAKNSCRVAMERQGIEWPAFLDCRRLPISNDICISRTLSLIQSNVTGLDTMQSITPDTFLSTTTRPSFTNKRRRKMKKVKPANRIPSTSTTTARPILTSETPSPDSATTMTLDTTSLLTFSSPSTSSASTYDNVMTTTPAPTPEETPSTTSLASSSSLEVTTTNSSLDISITTTVAPFITQTSTAHIQSANHNSTSLSYPIQDYSSMPINITNDLTQLICSTSPDWLIKTKLTDNQLISATRRHDLKVRVFRQVFGSLSSGLERNISRSFDNQKPLVLANRNMDNTSRKNSINLNLTLSNATMFITAIGPTLYNQPLTNALVSKNGPNEQFHSSPSHKTGRYYLISGTGQASNAKLANVFIIWPNLHRGTGADSDSRASRQVLKTYREFKLNGLKVCDRLGSMTRSGVARDARRFVRARKNNRKP